MNITPRTITLITHVQNRYLGGMQRLIANCQRLASSPLAGQVIEHRASEGKALLQHNGRVNVHTGKNYQLGELSADNVILAGGSLLLPESYYPQIPANQIGRCQFAAFNALLDDLKIEPGRTAPVKLHFAADTLYYSAAKVEVYDGEREVENIIDLVPSQPDVLNRYEQVIADRGLNSQVQLYLWNSVDDLFTHLSKIAV